MDQQKTLDWLKEVSEQAYDEARGGNGALLNKIGSNPALSYYFNNVHSLNAITPQQYAEQAPGFVEAAEKYRQEYEALAAIPEDHNRLNAVEGELGAIKAQLAQVLAKLNEKAAPAKPTPVADPKKPAAPAKKSKADDTAEDDAESEA